MSDRQKKQEKAKIKSRILKAADKVGHGLRKAGPYIIAVGLGIFINTLGRDKNDTDKT